MVHGLVGHATSDGPITNHSHTVVFATLQAQYWIENCCNFSNTMMIARIHNMYTYNHHTCLLTS